MCLSELMLPFIILFHSPIVFVEPISEDKELVVNGDLRLWLLISFITTISRILIIFLYWNYPHIMFIKFLIPQILLYFSL